LTPYDEYLDKTDQPDLEDSFNQSVLLMYQKACVEHPGSIVRYYGGCRDHICADCANICTRLGMLNICPVCGSSISFLAAGDGGRHGYTCGCGAELLLCLTYDLGTPYGVIATAAVFGINGDDVI